MAWSLSVDRQGRLGREGRQRGLEPGDCIVRHPPQFRCHVRRWAWAGKELGGPRVRPKDIQAHSGSLTINRGARSPPRAGSVLVLAFLLFFNSTPGAHTQPRGPPTSGPLLSLMELPQVSGLFLKNETPIKDLLLKTTHFTMKYVKTKHGK